MRTNMIYYAFSGIFEFIGARKVGGSTDLDRLLHFLSVLICKMGIILLHT